MPPVEHYEPTFLQNLKGEGPIGLLCVLLSVAFTVALVINRGRRCFRPLPQEAGRDLAFLMCGPILVLLYAVIYFCMAIPAYLAGGIDSDYPLRHGLRGVQANCLIALVCFIAGMLAFCLPAKSSHELRQ